MIKSAIFLRSRNHTECRFRRADGKLQLMIGSSIAKVPDTKSQRLVSFLEGNPEQSEPFDVCRVPSDEKRSKVMLQTLDERLEICKAPIASSMFPL